jgi:lipopolysaccharide transport system ATP-binding protein
MTLGEIRRVYENIVDFSELGDAIENPIRTYSNGMIARLGFSTIIHTPADIILIDEVLAVGDSRFKQKCIKHFRDFKARDGTLIIVSHEMETLADMCEVGMCLELGQVAEIGRMDRVIARHEAFMQQGTDAVAETSHSSRIG